LQPSQTPLQTTSDGCAQSYSQFQCETCWDAFDVINLSEMDSDWTLRIPPGSWQCGLAERSADTAFRHQARGSLRNVEANAVLHTDS
jgi:hypothetical protein